MKKDFKCIDDFKPKKKYLAIIPARYGSKRLPKKNILPLAGHPLIAYTINSVKTLSNKIDHIFTSDDEEIRKIADSVYLDAQKMLKKYSKQLKRVAEALLEYETLDGDQIRDLCKGLNISINKSEDKDEAPKAKKPKKRAGIPSTTSAKQTIVTNEIDNF